MKSVKTNIENAQAGGPGSGCARGFGVRCGAGRRCGGALSRRGHFTRHTVSAPSEKSEEILPILDSHARIIKSVG